MNPPLPSLFVVVSALVAGGCASPPEADLTLRTATPALGTHLTDARDIEFVFDYDILPAGLRHGGVKDGTVTFDGFGMITWSDGSTGSSHPFFRESTRLELGSELHGRNVRWVYPAEDLTALISFAREPKLDKNGRPASVVSVELKGGLNWTYGCVDREAGGTASCPAHLGTFESFGPLVID